LDKERVIKTLLTISWTIQALCYHTNQNATDRKATTPERRNMTAKPTVEQVNKQINIIRND
jgi:hypothetical protein